MPLQSITYLISPQGKVTIEVQGAQGKSCMDISRRVMEALGESESTELKPEYYQGRMMNICKISREATSN